MDEVGRALREKPDEVSVLSELSNSFHNLPFSSIHLQTMLQVQKASQRVSGLRMTWNTRYNLRMVLGRHSAITSGCCCTLEFFKRSCHTFRTIRRCSHWWR